MKEYIVKADFITKGEELVPPDIVSELIRCKDCRWFINKECAIYCLSSAHEEAFCSYAEPKDG